MSTRTDLIEVRVTRKTMEALGIASFELARVDRSSLPAFEPGAHIDVHTPEGIARQYSLCNSPDETHRYLIAVLRDPQSRGGSAALVDKLFEGDLVQISAPRNHFQLAAGSSHTLLIGGGIGITPLLAMAESLSREGRPFELHYCTRSPAHTAFHAALKEGNFSDRVEFHFDDGAAEQRLDITKKLSSCDANTHLYVCGPKGFMDAVLGAARSEGWADERVHFEYFAADVMRKADDGAFEVEIASTGDVYVVPADKSICDVLIAHGIDIPMSCEEGVCGTCATGVIAGLPDHRDMYLTRTEQAKNDQMMLCCSRAKSARLVLEL